MTIEVVGIGDLLDLEEERELGGADGKGGAGEDGAAEAEVKQDVTVTVRISTTALDAGDEVGGATRMGAELDEATTEELGVSWKTWPGFEAVFDGEEGAEEDAEGEAGTDFFGTAGVVWGMALITYSVGVAEDGAAEDFGWLSFASTLAL